MTSILRIIEGRARDLGGFAVRRMLPAAGMQTVGPFIFFDHMGPVVFPLGHGVDVRPHPHIGLATVTYLYDGAFMHRDSLGSAQVIHPGDVNWMVAGRGIVHSERTPPELRSTDGASRAHGIQTWVALPVAHEETEPSFEHHPAESLPTIRRPGAMLRVIAGDAWGRAAPVRVFSKTLYVDATLEQGAVIDLPDEHEQRAAYVAIGQIVVEGTAHTPGQMVVFAPGRKVRIESTASSRVMLLGGEPLDGQRRIWWNFVSSSRERIERAKADWREERFAPVPDDPERIPLPED
jgi:redox-sensitive bicupin YhaK (pirin superfamily)